MKTYKKPSTEIHQIEAVLMAPASPLSAPAVTNTTATTNASGDYDDAKQSILSTTSLWDEEE